MTEEPTEPNTITLEIGTLVEANGSRYKLKFPATFYPSPQDPFYGQMIDQWGSRSFVRVIDAMLAEPSE